MNITRRDALLGATAAAAVTGLIVAPLAMKAAGVKLALADEPLLAMEQKYLAFRDYCNNYPDESAEAVNPLFDRLSDMEAEIYETPAATLDGTMVKLRLWADYYATFSDHHSYQEVWWWGDLSPMYLDETGFAYVMRDLERLAGEARS